MLKICLLACALIGTANAGSTVLCYLTPVDGYWQVARNVTWMVRVGVSRYGPGKHYLTCNITTYAVAHGARTLAVAVANDKDPK
jgi:hypothetical protein